LFRITLGQTNVDLDRSDLSDDISSLQSVREEDSPAVRSVEAEKRAFVDPGKEKVGEVVFEEEELSQGEKVEMR